MKKQEKYDKLCEMIESITGGVKIKETGLWINPVKGRLNKNFATPEIAVCLEDLQYMKEMGCYSYEDRKGKTWFTIGLNVWGKEEPKQTQPEPRPPAIPEFDVAPALDFEDDNIPF